MKNMKKTSKEIMLLKSVSEKDAKEMINANKISPNRDSSSYKCQFCGLSLGKRQNIRRMIKAHVEKHLKMTIECGQCSDKASFIIFHLLMQHKMKYHDQQRNEQKDEKKPILKERKKIKKRTQSREEKT